LTPTAFPSTTGNASTAERWRRSLVKEGHDVWVLATENLDVFALQQMLAHFKPDLIHLHHAFRTGELLSKLNTEWANNGWALVVSPGGTDIHLDTKVEDRRRIITQVFERVKAVIAQSEEMMQRIVEAYPQLQGRVIMIPKSFCWMGEEEFSLRGLQIAVTSFSFSPRGYDLSKEIWRRFTSSRGFMQCGHRFVRSLPVLPSTKTMQ
jgi:hypothetical protein